MGKITILIGPNGFGKTFALDKIYRNRLIENGVEQNEIFFMPAEIYLEDEIKDTDSSTTRSKTMEFLLTDLFNSNLIDEKKNELKKVIDSQILANQDIINSAFQDSARLNESERTKNIIEESTKFTLSKQVTINAVEFKSLLGSGQKYFFFMQLLKRSKKKYIFLDEPEQYSHPSLQNALARIIEEMLKDERELYISTHSPKLISMLNIELNSIRIINDVSHIEKTLDFTSILGNLNNKLNTAILSLDKIDKSFYLEENLNKMIKEYYYRDFLEALFTKKVILCEGFSDELFIKNVLFKSRHYYDDYFIFRVNGKFKIPVFADILTSIGIEVRIYFDKDNETDHRHKDFNDYIKTNYSKHYYMFDTCLEKEIGISDQGNKVINTRMLEFLEVWKFDDKYDIW